MLQLADATRIYLWFSGENYRAPVGIPGYLEDGTAPKVRSIRRGAA